MMSFELIARLDWFKKILYERFGHTFTLKLEMDKALIISLPYDARLIKVAIDIVTFNRADSDLPCSRWDAEAEGWKSPLASPLHAPGISSLPSPLITSKAMEMHIAYDIFGLTYWMLSRQEEVGRTDLDHHGRFPATSSHAYKHDYLDRPVVDEWLHVLGQVIQRQWPGIELKRHEFQTRVSHDVDQPSLYAFLPWKTIARMMAGHILKRRDPKAFFTASYVKLATRGSLIKADPYNTFDWLMDVSEVNGLKSAFYFICGRTHPDTDADYEIEHPIMRDLLRSIHSRGHEIGLHPSYNTVRDDVALKREADRLKRVCAEEGIKQDQWGGRMHYLRWEHPTTMQAWVNADMNYDSTLGYADHVGFRCGTCHEYPSFDPVRQEQLNLRIRPLIAMECSVIDEAYMGLGTGREAEEVFINLKESCRHVQGCFSFLWHNSYFITENLKSTYSSLLANKKNA
jgi:hypothetical protein